MRKCDKCKKELRKGYGNAHIDFFGFGICIGYEWTKEEK